MLRTDKVREVLADSSKPMAFDAIWKEVSEDVKETITIEKPDEQLKADLYLSLMEDSRLIMVGDGLWDLKERYSIYNQEIIEKARMTEETELVWEESDETKELNLKIVYADDEIK